MTVDKRLRDAAAVVERDNREMFAVAVRAMDAVDIDLAPTSLRALLALDELGECSLGELARTLSLSQSSASRMVDGLVHRNLVRRQPSAKDRRYVEVSLTPAGRKAARRLVRRRCEDITRVLQRMSSTDLDKLLRGLRGFAAAARDARLQEEQVIAAHAAHPRTSAEELHTA